MPKEEEEKEKERERKVREKEKGVNGLAADDDGAPSQQDWWEQQGWMSYSHDDTGPEIGGLSLNSLGVGAELLRLGAGGAN